MPRERRRDCMQSRIRWIRRLGQHLAISRRSAIESTSSSAIPLRLCALEHAKARRSPSGSAGVPGVRLAHRVSAMSRPVRNAFRLHGGGMGSEVPTTKEIGSRAPLTGDRSRTWGSPGSSMSTTRRCRIPGQLLHRQRSAEGRCGIGSIGGSFF